MLNSRAGCASNTYLYFSISPLLLVGPLFCLIHEYTIGVPSMLYGVPHPLANSVCHLLVGGILPKRVLWHIDLLSFLSMKT